MGRVTANVFIIPHFLRASTREGLMRLMLLNNMKHSREFKYSTPQFVGKEWTVWFDFEVDVKEKVKAELSKVTDGNTR